MNKVSIIQSAIVLVAGVLFSLALFFGWTAGQSSAVSSTVIKNAKQQAAGFEYFKSDQDRYPSEFEYANPDLMGIYFNVFPPAQVASEQCPESFQYQTPDSRDYKLNFCIPRALGGYLAGWNTLSSPDSP